MNNPIFKKSDFTLCEVPVTKGYLQSQTHCGVAPYKEKLYLTTSPYPSIRLSRYHGLYRSIIRKLTMGLFFKQYVAEEFENPFLYCSSEPGLHTKFHLVQNKPLMECPDRYYGLPAFNSDPDVFIEEETIHILNRVVYRTKMCPGEPLNKYNTRLYLITGKEDESKFRFQRNILLKDSDERMIVSPCLEKHKDEYILFELETNAYNDGQSFHGLYYIKNKQLDELKDNENWIQVEVVNCDFLPWHMSTFCYGGKLYAIVASIKKGYPKRCWQMFGEFNEDLTQLKIYKTPLTDYCSYRSSSYVRNDGTFVLYNTTVYEKITGGKSVDGREIIMAHMPFEELLKQLKDNE